MLWLGSVQSAFMKKGAFLHARQGFTLLELMVTLAVVGILSVAAAPAIQGFATRSAMNALEGDFTKALTRARLEAVSNNMCVSVCQRSTAGGNACASGTETLGQWHNGWVVYRNPSCTSTTPDAADVMAVREPGSPRYLLKDIGKSPDLVLTYNARGLLRDGATTLSLTDAKDAQSPNKRNLTLNFQGRVAAMQYSATADE